MINEGQVIKPKTSLNGLDWVFGEIGAVELRYCLNVGSRLNKAHL